MFHGHFPKIQNIVFAALFAAMFCVLTIIVKIPTDAGYIHLGDVLLYIAAALLPTPYAMLAGAVGGSIADLLGGYTHYIIPTMIIKALITLPFSSKSPKILSIRNKVAPFISAVISIFGYYLAKVVLIALASGNPFFPALLSAPSWASALYKIPENALQSGFSAALFLFISAIFDRANLKSKLVDKIH